MIDLIEELRNRAAHLTDIGVFDTPVLLIKAANALDDLRAEVFALTGEVANKAEYARNMWAMYEAAKERLDAQAGSIEAVQAANQRLAAQLEVLSKLPVISCPTANVTIRLTWPDGEQKDFVLNMGDSLNLVP
jgi:hypothetical protein